ncbi:MAG: ArsR/SmtB family transcription factor [Bryobacteraceae bacterium]
MFDCVSRFQVQSRPEVLQTEVSIPSRAWIAKELAELLGAIAHPHRLRILFELHHGEIDVNGLQKIVGISHSGVSQNLSILRAHHLVRERREGRRVFYSLTNPRVAEWLIEGLEFLADGLIHHEDLRIALQEARQRWTGPKEP